MRPRLCLATDSLEPSGVGEHMLVLAHELRSDHEITLACPPSPGGSPLLERAAHLGVTARPLDQEEDTALWLREGAFELLHVHAGIGWEGHRLAAAGREAAVPRIVRTEHLPDLVTDPGQRHDYATGIGMVDRVICVSAASAQSYAGGCVDHSKFVVIRNGLPHRPATRTRAAVREDLGLAARQRVALTAARFTAQKDHATLIEALPPTLSEMPDLSFVFAGDGQLRGACEERAAALGVAHATKFLGMRFDVPDLLAAVDLFVLSSRFEGLPLAVIEAMAAGLPVVATRVGGTDELVLDGVTGLLVPPGDSAALARAITELCREPGRAKAVGEAGRARYDAEFTAIRMASETARLYRSLR